MATARWLKGILDRYGVRYEVRSVGAGHVEAQALTHQDDRPRTAKTIIMADRGRPLMLVVPDDARMDFRRVSAVVGGHDLRLASSAEIRGWFVGCQLGCVPPLRLRADLTILMDRGLAHLGTLLFPAETADKFIAVSFRDWYRAVRPGIGRFTVPSPGETENQEPAPVLIVEDEADTNHLLCRLVEQGGYSCRGVEQGGEALEFARQMPPAAILLDVMLPDMSGFEVYERLRRTGPLKRIPVIVVSAIDDEVSRRRSRELGADAFLTKPFLPEALAEEIDAVLSV